MKGLVSSCGALVLLVGATQVAAEGGAPTHVSPRAIMLRAVARARKAQTLPDCQYFQHSSERDFDSKGKVAKETDELYRVVIRDGDLHSSLLEVNGQELSARQARVREKEEEVQEQKLRGHRAGLEDARPQTLLTRDMVDRYDFTLRNMETFHGRKTYRLAFTPRPGLRVHDLTDRFFNHIAGTVWIDAQDYELARAEIHLTSEFKLWGGILADVKQCDFTLEQTRLSDGTWLNRTVHGIFEARKFLVTMRVEIDSDSTDFHLVPHTASTR